MARRRRIFADRTQRAEPGAPTGPVHHGVPPSISAEGREPLEPNATDHPDEIPVEALGSMPADQWGPPAPPQPPTDPHGGWVAEEPDTSLGDLLTAPGSPAADPAPQLPPAQPGPAPHPPESPELPPPGPELAAPPPALPAAPTEAPSPPGAGASPRALGPARETLTTAMRDLDELLDLGEPTSVDTDPHPEPAADGAGLPPRGPTHTTVGTGGDGGGGGGEDLDLDNLFDDDDEVPAADGGGWVSISEAVPAAQSRSAPKGRGAPGVYTPPTKRRMEYTRAGELIERVTALIGNRPELAGRIAKFVLTRDAALDAAQRDELAHIITRNLTDVAIPVTAEDLPELIDLVYDELIGLGPLGDPWRDPAVTEIMVDAWDKVYVEVGGKLLTTNYRFRDPDHAEQVARGLAERVSGRTVSPTNPLVTAELPGARVNFALRPVVRSGLAITLRKLNETMGMSKLLELGALTTEMAEFLHDAVAARASVLVSGGTGVGKTTLLNALSEAIGDDERVVTIEDSYELSLANQFVVSMQTKEAASADDQVIIDQVLMLRNALRMRPDRIIVGETRDPVAAAVMLDAANTGHEGTMTTIHANDADSALNVRLTNLVRTALDHLPADVARWQVAQAFDLVVQGTRSHLDGRRYVAEIAEVTTEGLQEGGRIQLNPVFIATARPNEPIEFQRVGRIRDDGRLARRLAGNGVDVARWA